jgi:hypothetical protein
MRKLRKENIIIAMFYVFQPIFTIHTLTKECFDADDVDETSWHYQKLQTEHDKKYWLFRQGFFYGTGLFGSSIIQITLNINWWWS